MDAGAIDRVTMKYINLAGLGKSVSFKIQPDLDLGVQARGQQVPANIC